MDIDELLNRYFEGETSSEEERELRAFFTSGNVPDRLAVYTPMFTYLEEESRKERQPDEALIPIDEYWEEYPNIRQYMTNEQWDMLRQEDGHIYWIPQFGVTNGKSSDVIHDGEAFWIQTRVLKWAGYPEVHTVE